MDLTSMISALGEGQIPNLRQGPGAKTAFSDLGGSFTIASGIVETDNLKMTSSLLKVAASAKIDLVQSTIDMLANPEVVAGAEGKSGANDLAGLSVPIRIEGPLDAPKINPEIKVRLRAQSRQTRRSSRRRGDQEEFMPVRGARPIPAGHRPRGGTTAARRPAKPSGR
jgi:AsmA protein